MRKRLPVSQAGAYFRERFLPQGYFRQRFLPQGGGERILTDGPFVETKEHLLGFYLVEVSDLDGAIDWAARMPHIRHGTVEVRPVPFHAPPMNSFLSRDIALTSLRCPPGYSLPGKEE